MNARSLGELFNAIHHGKFEFADFIACDVNENYERVPWRNRTIFKPSKKLKVFQSFLNAVVFERMETNEAVAFAYRKGASTALAVAPHAKSRAFYQTDLRKFFDCITTPLIRRTLKRCELPIKDLFDHEERVLSLVTVEGRLPIGFATSPYISNACMKPFDDELEREARGRELIYTRYADDIIISGRARADLEGIEETIATLLLKELGPEFQINNEKTRRTTIGRKIKALGLVVLPNGTVAVSIELKKKVEYQLHFFATNRARFADIFDDDIEVGIQQLAGNISHISGSDPDFLEKLRRKYGATVIDSFLHRSAK